LGGETPGLVEVLKQNKAEEAKMKPQVDKTDPDRIVTETVQYWKGGVMLTAMMKKEVAKELVRTGEAYIITSQAIQAAE